MVMIQNHPYTSHSASLYHIIVNNVNNYMLHMIYLLILYNSFCNCFRMIAKHLASELVLQDIARLIDMIYASWSRFRESEPLNKKILLIY